jgi:hypothetical protein
VPDKTITFKVDADGPIARWYESLERGERSEAIRRALRARIGAGEPDPDAKLDDVLDTVHRIERRLEDGLMVQREDWDEPDEAAGALDALAEIGGGN